MPNICHVFMYVLSCATSLPLPLAAHALSLKSAWWEHLNQTTRLPRAQYLTFSEWSRWFSQNLKKKKGLKRVLSLKAEAQFALNTSSYSASSGKCGTAFIAEWSYALQKWLLAVSHRYTRSGIPGPLEACAKVASDFLKGPYLPPGSDIQLTNV